MDPTQPIAIQEWKHSKILGIVCCSRRNFLRALRLWIVPAHADDPPPLDCRSPLLHPRRHRFLSCHTWCCSHLPLLVNDTCPCWSLHACLVEHPVGFLRAHTCSRRVCWRGHVTRMQDAFPTDCRPRSSHTTWVPIWRGKGAVEVGIRPYSSSPPPPSPSSGFR